MWNLPRVIVVLLCGPWLVAAPGGSARAAAPEVTVKTEEGWIRTTYLISMNKEAAVKLRDAVDRVDPKLIGGALIAATPHPALKIAIAVVAGNADAFKRALSKDGTIGQGGIIITLTTHGGWVGKQAAKPTTPVCNPIADKFSETVGDAMQVAVNPWSWSIAPRK